MARRMSFAMTQDQILDRSKTVTRRMGWKFLKPGDKVRAVSKCMGIRPGEVVEDYGLLEVVSVRRERIDSITREDVIAEGFPDMTPGDFMMMFCTAMKCRPWDECTRIEFRHLESDSR